MLNLVVFPSSAVAFPCLAVRPSDPSWLVRQSRLQEGLPQIWSLLRTDLLGGLACALLSCSLMVTGLTSAICKIPTQSLPDDKLFCPSAGLHISEETAKFYLEDAQGDLKRAYQLHRECLSLCKTCGASLYLPE